MSINVIKLVRARFATKLSPKVEILHSLCLKCLV